MAVDLQEVQRAANEARKNFIAAAKLDLDAYENTLIAYLDDFINTPVKRPEKVLKCARNAKEIAGNFSIRFNDIVNEVALLALEQNAAASGATVGTMDLMVKGFGSYLGKLTDSIISGSGGKDIPNEPYDQAAVEKIVTQAAALGNANALAQQLAANLVVDHLEAISTFCTENLREKSIFEAVRSFKSQEIVEVLSEVVSEIADIPLIGLIMNISSMIDKKRARKAGVARGDTDIMFELEEILSEDFTGLETVMAALEQVRELSSALRQ